MSPQSTTQRRRFRSRIWLLVLTVGLVTLLLESAMQVAAYVIWAQQRKPVAVASGKTVLCIGDSWTHGMGSEDPMTGSYPARMQTLLREHGVAEWTVVNGGQSGQNSRDVLERLPSQLAQYQPRIVCVLVGQNDYWSLPKMIEADESATFDHSAYRFRWRLPRLLHWAIGNIRGVGSAPQAVRDPEQWRAREVPQQPDPYPNQPSTWPWTPEIEKLKVEGWRLVDARDYAGAQKSFESALAASPGDPQCHQMLAQLHRLAGREALARQELDWLRAAHHASTGFHVDGALAVTLEDAGQWRECLDVLQPLLERFPDSAQFWRQYAWCQYQLGELDQALASIDRSIALGYDKWTYFCRYKICFTGKQDVDEAARSLFACYLQNNDAGLLSENLRTMGRAEHLLRVREVARIYPCADAVRERLIAITAEVHRSLDNQQATATLASHLERIVIAARNAGATPVLLCYPWWNEAEATLRAVALDHGTLFIEVGKLFEAGGGATTHQHLRAPDGHCNDAGYQRMAAIVEAQLRPLVQAPGK